MRFPLRCRRSVLCILSTNRQVSEAGAAAARLLGNVRVQARIAEIMRAGAERAEVTVEQVVRELKLIGFSDIRKVVSWRNELVTRTEKGKDGEPVMVEVVMPRVTIVDADKISDEAAAAVAEVWQTVNGALRVKLHDKHAALVSLGRHLRGGPGCVVHGGTHQSLGKHCESLPAEVRARPDAGSPVRL